MSKIELNNIVNTQNVQLINDNFQKIEDVINEKMLSRDPEGEPNTLQAPLDLNNQRVLNAPKPTQPTDLVRLQDIGEMATDLSGKQDTLVSGVNIKTINNQSLLGSGNIEVVSGGGTTDHSALLNRNLPDQHSIESITGLQGELSSKAATVHSHVTGDISDLQAALDSKANSTHTHNVTEVTGLQTALDSKQPMLVSGSNIKTLNGISLLGNGDIVLSGGGGGTPDHNSLTNREIADQHPIAAITGLQTALDGKASTTTATTTSSGLMSSADKTKLDGIASGATANSTDAQLRDRSTHTGTQAISTVTGLQAALDSKQVTLVSGTNIKTVNGTSILGSGDITVSGGGSSDWILQNATLTAQTNTSYALTVSFLTNVNLASLVSGKFFSISNDPASTANVRIVKPGIIVRSSKGLVSTADDIILTPGQHFYAYAVSTNQLRVPLNG